MQYKYFEPEIEWIDGEEYTKVLSENGILTRRRKELGMTQEKVAEQAGIQLCQYQHFESGERTLSGSSGRILLSVSKVLQLDPFIFVGSGNEPTERHIVIPQNFANECKLDALTLWVQQHKRGADCLPSIFLYAPTPCCRKNNAN